MFVRGVLYVTVHDVKDISLEASMLSRLTGRELHLHGTYAKVSFFLEMTCERYSYCVKKIMHVTYSILSNNEHFYESTHA